MKKVVLLVGILGLTLLLSHPGYAEQISAQSLQQQADNLWADRGNQASLQKAISLYEKLYSESPSYATAEQLSRAYYFLADSFLQGEDKINTYYKGFEWGVKAMETDPTFKKLYKDEGKGIDVASQHLGKDYEGAIYWAGASIGKWAKMKGIFSTLEYSSKAKKMIEHAYALDKTYFYGGPPRWLGVYYAVAPSLFGGSMKKSKEMFDESLKIAPDYFATRVLMAENYAVKMKDKALFKELLNYVISRPADIIPGIEPDQKIEQEKAKRLLSEENKLF
jgi:tetratricopeptide (TPR) repeat protein